MIHPVTQVFLHNPHALRVEFRLDDACLELWWSPRAGKSFAARDRNFSNRDNHLRVFERIEIHGCSLPGFIRCDYDPYHTVLVFKDRRLHLSPHPHEAALLLWSDAPLIVDFKTARYDEMETCSPTMCRIRHDEPADTFLFRARLGDGSGVFRYSPVHEEWNSHYVQAQAAPVQALEIRVALAENAGDPPHASTTPEQWLRAVEECLARDLAYGRIDALDHPQLETLRGTIVRCLHSMIDLSGAFRASLKAIYYLIWVRDASFAFHYQAAGGWPHKLPELCRLLLANPTLARGDGVPPGRMFAQLINSDYGKYEEDGLFYVVQTLFNYWTSTGDRRFFEGEHGDLLREALGWVEAYSFDPRRGLFGSRFADETPALRSRDYGWDFAIGKPSGDEHIRANNKPVVRSYDIYLNSLMHSTYAMLAAAAHGDEARDYAEKAGRLRNALEPLISERINGLPLYGELVCEDNSLERVPAWGPVSSVYVWALALPNFLGLPGQDQVRSDLLDRLLEKPDMHWINGLCAAAAAVDPWLHGEDRQLELLSAVERESSRPGKFLPMGGAMPEKFAAPDGDLYHDIRPQGFAMGAWLGAWSGLGVRRLPHGLALRPTRAFTALHDYPWRGRMLDFRFEATGKNVLLEINGQSVNGTLQIPEDSLTDGRNMIRICDVTDTPGPLWIRSSVLLLSVSPRRFIFEAFGIAEIVMDRCPILTELIAEDGSPIPFEAGEESGLHFLRFTHWGRGTLDQGRSL
jgi:hypothetical protein